MSKSHDDIIVDADPKLQIDVKTRKITSASTKNILMQYDHDSERIGFEMERYVDGHDMYQTDKITLHYTNGNRKDAYEITDKELSEDETKIVFTWLISNGATQNPGQIAFAINFRCINEEGVVTYNWSTAPCSIFTVQAGIYSIDNDPPIEFIDILESSINDALSKAKESGDFNGITPHIGENGNWFFGEEDTGLPSRGETPQKGVDYWTDEDKKTIEKELSQNLIDDTLTQAGKAAEAKTTGTKLFDVVGKSNGLIENITLYNSFYANLVGIWERKNFNSDYTGVIDSKLYRLIIVAIDGGEKYYFANINNARNNTIFFNTDFTKIAVMTDVGGYNQLVTVPENTAYVGILQELSYDYKNTTIIPEKYYGEWQLGYTGEISDKIKSKLKIPSQYISGEISISAQTDYEPKYMDYNRLDPAKITTGKYVMETNGNLGVNVSYDSTDYIDIFPDEELFVLTNTLDTAFVRTFAYYDENKKFISGVNSSITSLPYIEGARYVRASIKTGTANETMIVNNRNISKFYEFDDYKLKKQYIDPVNITGLSQAVSMCGSDTNTIKQETLEAQTLLKISNFPKNLKKNLSVSCKAKFDTFIKIGVGSGYGEYRGSWIEVDETNVTWKTYENSVITKQVTPHNLTINKFISISMYVDNDSVCHYSINTLSGTFSGTFQWAYENNGYPFVAGEQAMTDVVLNATSPDFKAPMWLFGDSYFGAGANRIIGQLKELGYINGVLIDGLAGQNSANAYRELTDSLNYGTPKYILWCMGMNDSDSDYTRYYQLVSNLAKAKNITLILMKIPTVPTRDKANINSIVESSGLRYIDAYGAVGANSSGEWYEGYLSSDGVHPSVLGAQALSMQILIDAPEIMQYGYNSGSAGDENVGDK